MGNAFHLENLDGPVALVTFDLPEKKVNTLGLATLQELKSVLDHLMSRDDLFGLLLQSGKPEQFIAGADLHELSAMATATAEQATAMLELGHEIFTRWSQLPFPTVALIDGPCMGGGTEFALAFDERICSNSSKTKISLPEVTIGLIPGWGGTQRLPRLIGAHYAIEMIGSGEALAPEQAAARGLVFDAVPREQILVQGTRLLQILRRDDAWRKSRQRREQPLGLTEDQVRFQFAVAEGQIQAKTKGQYPAPLVALRAIRDGVNLPLHDGLAVERRAALEVVGSPIAANLINIFFLNQRLARDNGVSDPTVKAQSVQRVGVLGAGLMGAGIATAHARRGLSTLMVDVDDARIRAGIDRARSVVEGRIAAGRGGVADVVDMFAHLATNTEKTAFHRCEVVIEAITENENLKTAAFRELATIVRPGTILASNTSTISISRMAEAAPDPAAFVGMHFFYPVDRMKLVEVVRGEKTSDATVATMVALAKQINKTPIVMRDCPGFLVNRVLFPYMNEALQLLLEGAEMDAIDQAALAFGMPMGPFTLHDLVGLDTACYAGKVLRDAYPGRSVNTELLAELVAAGRWGNKSGAGFRKLDPKRNRPVADPDFAPFLARHRREERTFAGEEITRRLFLPMLLEATRVWAEGIVREPGDVDMGLILGIGFPAFRGGILRWCDTEGPTKIVTALEPYAHLGERFAVTDPLRELACSGKKFYR